jgi:hypothetical protein
VHFAAGSDNCDGDFVAGPGEADSVGYGTAAAHFGSAASALPVPPVATALRLGNLNLAPSNNSTEYSLQAVSAATFAVAPGNLPTDLSFPRNNSRTVLAIAVPVGGVEQPQEALDQRATSVDGSDGDSALSARLTWVMVGFVLLCGVALGGAMLWSQRPRER